MLKAATERRNGNVTNPEPRRLYAKPAILLDADVFDAAAFAANRVSDGRGKGAVVSRWRKLVEQARSSRHNVRFSDLRALVERVGYTLDRSRGSHYHYRRPGFPAINLQEGTGGKAKHYQVAQVLAILDAMGIEVD